MTRTKNTAEPHPPEVKARAARRNGKTDTRTRWSHAYAEWLLLDIGRRSGHEVWVAAGDRMRVVGTVRLGDLALDRIPSAVPETTRAVMEHIDVVWFPAGRSNPVALFEIEHSTSIATGLLRMSDLLATLPAPVAGWQLTIVAPARRLGRFMSELARPTFRTTGLATACRFLSYDELLAMHRAALAHRRGR